MRKNKAGRAQNELSILALDDDEVMTLTLQAYFQSSGYRVDIENDPYKAIERVRNGHYDILLLDFLMTPICGDQVVAQIRQFNAELFIILLTGHKSMAPPIKTIRELDIQGYYEKSDRFDQLELLVESCVKSIRQMQTIRGYRDGLRNIVDEAPSLYRADATQELLETLLDDNERFFPEAKSFYYVRKTEEMRAREGNSPVLENEYFLGSEGVTLADAKESYAALQKQGFDAQKEDYQGTVLFPLVGESKETFGVAGLKLDEEVKADRIRLFELYTRQASAAISNAMLRELLGAKNVQLAEMNAKLRESYVEMVGAVRNMVDARDIYTRGHSDRVAHYAVLISKQMGKDQDYIDRIRVAGLFHDIGKIGISDQILLKNARLTAEEYDAIKKHPSKGSQILAVVSLFGEIAPIIRAHHERIDGAGYPDGIRAEQIPEEARIIAVADAFDAMTSHRRYRENMTREQAVDELLLGMGKQFDEGAVKAFLVVLKDYEKIRQELAWTFQTSAKENQGE